MGKERRVRHRALTVRESSTKQGDGLKRHLCFEFRSGNGRDSQPCVGGPPLGLEGSTDRSAMGSLTPKQTLLTDLEEGIRGGAQKRTVMRCQERYPELLGESRAPESPSINVVWGDLASRTQEAQGKDRTEPFQCLHSRACHTTGGARPLTNVPLPRLNRQMWSSRWGSGGLRGWSRALLRRGAPTAAESKRRLLLLNTTRLPGGRGTVPTWVLAAALLPPLVVALAEGKPAPQDEEAAAAVAGGGEDDDEGSPTSYHDGDLRPYYQRDRASSAVEGSAPGVAQGPKRGILFPNLDTRPARVGVTEVKR